MQYELIAEGIGQANQHYEEAAEELAHEFLRRRYMELEDAYNVYQAYLQNAESEDGKLWRELEVYANQVLYGEMHENSLITIEVEMLKPS
ncbi:hypothetical protein [Gilvimarinus sp. 1_MG-2023]|uniref:hypothetical protein n=1 Tax=Gilvimarinus sp. 1_MG-2023 TaxID=3062638 RepID=UPI0026E146D2|nr:hypothetical protein [Gilvimarinus sp. 1_MG-2023]MDO6748053.1 hypothetical protein [Gilvimarinus sp. 1_MG-2023]